MDSIWTYRNNIYHENTNQQVARYKTEALDRRYEEVWDKHAGLVQILNAFQTKHFKNRTRIGNLYYESKCCWGNLLEQYITEAASPIRTEMYNPNSWAQYLEWDELVTSQLFERGIVDTILFVLV
jgi:hypothetical protein